MALGGPIQAIPHDARPVIKPVHASTPHTTTTTATKATPAPSWLTTAGLEATKQANDAVAPEVQGLQGQQANYDAQQKSYEAAMTGFYSALAPYMAGISGNVSDAYNSAAKTMGDIGHGYAGVLGANADANTAEMNAALTRAGQTPVAGSTAPMTDAFAATHGGAEGSAFAQEGAAKAAAAAGTPAVWAAQGRDGLTEAIQKAVEGDAGWAQKISDVYAKVPALRQQILTTMQDLKIKQDTFDLNKAAKIEQLNQGRARLAQGDTRLGLQAASAAFDHKYKIAGLKLRGQALQLQAQKFAQATYNADRNYGIAFARLGISKKKMQIAALASQYKLNHGGYDQKAIDKFNGILQKGLNGIQTQNNPDGTTTYLRPDPSDKTGKKMVKTSYAEFLATAVAHGVPPSVAIDRANKFFPPSARPQGPGATDFLLGTGASGGGPGRSADVLQAANTMLGTPYVWGGNKVGQGLDCSGFIQQSYKQVGINLPRTTYQQVKAGRPVKLNQLQPGDAIFTIPNPNGSGPEHVGMYIGNGQVQVSPTTGDVNKIVSLKSYLTLGFVAARRYLPRK